ncbi:MAG: hypothetical protein KAU21_14625 [Gammaproteobacteria bacterium]|nr:hypothetical protein [Gammaproteobacteria bacterium]
MFSRTTAKYLKLVPLTALALSLTLTGKALADESSNTITTTSSDQQFQTLINWSEEMQTTLSRKMDNNLKLEMQALAYNLPEKPVYANQLTDSAMRDVVLIKADKDGAGITALSTTPVVVIIDRKELCLLNI